MTNAPRVYLDQPAKDVAIGAEQACALLENGHVRCWGLNDKAQLGIGRVSDDKDFVGDDETPCQGADVILGNVNAIGVASGFDHSCALLEGGKLRCWGNNEKGQLGYGIANPLVGDTPERTPEALGDVDVPGRVVQVALGDKRTCALADEVPLPGGATANGVVYCWGDNTEGQLGLGSRRGVLGNTSDETPRGIGPINLDVATGVQAWKAKQISGQWYHFCAAEAVLATEAGRLRCWGQNKLDGRTGHVSELGGDPSRDVVGDEDAEVPAMIGPVDLGLGLGVDVVEVGVGLNFSCARLSTGKVRCWGNNKRGELGLGHTHFFGDDEPINQTTPLVPELDVNLGAPARRLVVGRWHSCAQLTNGETRCWGQNDSGQLGLGHANDVGDNEAPVAAQPIPACADP
ncbi:MAG: hypothetical protein MUF34_38410, partial [Polyangiaceae bacterium]|nr:hypothetical protein [Polyangiaceae bacterium]